MNKKTLIEEFGNKNDVFTAHELVLYVNKNGNFHIGKNSVNNFIKKWCDENVIYSYYNGLYKLTKHKKKYNPWDDSKVNKYLCPLEEKGIFAYYFDSALYNEFTSLQAIKHYVCVCVEGYAENYIIDYFLKKNVRVIKSNDLSKLQRDLPLLSDNYDFIIKTFNEDTPLYKKMNTKCSNIFYPKIETILVNVLSDKYLRKIYSAELGNIFKNVFAKYCVNLNSLIRFAKKKGVEKPLINILKDINFNINKGEFVYD